jgi:hypothetical protein
MKDSTKRRLIESTFYASIFTFSGFGLYYAFGLMVTLAQGGDTVKFFLDSILGGFLAFVFFWFFCWEVTGMFERFNEEGRKEHEKRLEEEKKRIDAAAAAKKRVDRDQPAPKDGDQKEREPDNKT